MALPAMNIDHRLVAETRPVRLGLALAVGCGLLGGVLMVGQARILSLVIDRVFLGGQTLAGGWVYLAALGGIALVRALFQWVQQVAASRVALHIKSDLRDRLVAHLAALGPAYSQGERSGELSHTLVEGVDALDAYFSQYLPQLALAGLVPFTILALVLPLDLLSGVVLLVTAPLIPVFMILIGHTAESLTRRQYTALSRMSAHFLDTLQGLTTLKLFNRSREQIEAIARITDRYRQTTLGVLRVAFLSAFVLEMVGTIGTAIVAVEIGLRLLHGRLPFVDALFILLLTPDFYLPLRTLGVRFHSGMAGTAAAQRIFEVLETPLPAGLPASRSAYPVHGPIRFEGVHYAYEDGERPALNGVSLEIGLGQTVALVGPSGGGKSTIVSLLLRFIEPQQGMITVGGLPLREIPAGVWREQVAWVPQRPYLFNGSVAENIALARPDATRHAIVQAAQLAQAHAFIEALPQGYDTPIGERGARLSGGQTQRIALARAFLKNAPLVILDEPTANLDPEHEALIQQAMERLRQGRTALVVAHRLNTVIRADRIFVLLGGRVVQSGIHRALARQPGVYRRLVGAYWTRR